MRAFALILALLLVAPAFAVENGNFTPDSELRPEVPQGVVTEFTFSESKIYPGTTRSYWVYLPPGFNPEFEFPFMVFLDGGSAVQPDGTFRVPVVLNNLIYKKEIPPLVAIFVNPGDFPLAKGAKVRSNRDLEYDSPGDACARFLIEEIIPLATKHAKLSKKSEDHALMGISTGGIAAFYAAWQCPDYFRKIVCYTGTLTNTRGAVWFPVAIRQTERKPIRVFIHEDSSNYYNSSSDTYVSNQQIALALKFAGYDYKSTMGPDGRCTKQGGAILPDALRWVWRPAEALPPPTQKVHRMEQAVTALMVPGEDWKLVVGDKKFAEAACTDAAGNFYFSDSEGGGIFKSAVDYDGDVELFNPAKGITGMKFGPDGRIYACRRNSHQLVAFEKDGKEKVLASDVWAADLVVTHRGHVCFPEIATGQIKLWESPGRLRSIYTAVLPTRFTGIALSPDQETLAAACFTQNSWALLNTPVAGVNAQSPGTLLWKFSADFSWRGIVCDTRGRYYSGTSVGIHVMEPNRIDVGLILPPIEAPVTNVALSGPGLSWLFALTQGKVFKRKLNAKGFVTSAPPVAAEEKRK